MVPPGRFGGGNCIRKLVERPIVFQASQSSACTASSETSLVNYAIPTTDVEVERINESARLELDPPSGS